MEHNIRMIMIRLVFDKIRVVIYCISRSVTMLPLYPNKSVQNLVSVPVLISNENIHSTFSHNFFVEISLIVRFDYCTETREVNILTYVLIFRSESRKMIGKVPQILVILWIFLWSDIFSESWHFEHYHVSSESILWIFCRFFVSLAFATTITATAAATSSAAKYNKDNGSHFYYNNINLGFTGVRTLWKSDSWILFGFLPSGLAFWKRKRTFNAFSDSSPKI